MYTSKKIFPLQWETPLQDREILRVNAYLHQMENQAPYFSITGEIYVPGEDDIRAGGCIHDEILKAWPGLRPLVALHLCDVRGVPMHGVENAWYWAGGTHWELNKDGRTEPSEVLASHLRITLGEAIKIRDWVVKWKAWAEEPFEVFHPRRAEMKEARMKYIRQVFDWWVKEMKPRWEEEAFNGMKLLGASVPEIEEQMYGKADS